MNKILLYLLFTCSCYAGGQGGRIIISGDRLNATKVNAGKIGYIGYTRPVSNDTTVASGQTLVLNAGGIYIFTNLTVNDGGFIQITNLSGTTPAWTQIICTNFTCASATPTYRINTDLFPWISANSLNVILDGFDGFKTNRVYPGLSVTTGGNIYGGTGGQSGGGYYISGTQATYKNGLPVGGNGSKGFNTSTGDTAGGVGVAGWATTPAAPSTINDSTGSGDIFGSGGAGGTPGQSAGLLYMRVIGTLTSVANFGMRSSGQAGGVGGVGQSVNDTGPNSINVYGGNGGNGGRGGISGSIILRYTTLSGVLPTLLAALPNSGAGGAGGTANTVNGNNTAGSIGTGGGSGTVGSTAIITP